ncbi:MAG: methyltransferase domain-containing protein [Chitinophagaceae bacterium]|nr:MAG: methyltransferase domain-containing protein [Chitinophagaceae bacterium]
MEPLPLQPYSVTLGAVVLTLLVPDAAAVEARYRAAQLAGAKLPFPYWSRIWPSARVLAGFLLRHPGLTGEKRVLELAAGLGLPSLAAARNAASVTCSEYLPEALDVLRASFARYPALPVEIRCLDWNALPGDLSADVLLLSDVNYAPAEFPALLAALRRLLGQGSLLLLATPQRLAGRDFVDALLPFCRHREVHPAGEPGSADIEVLVLSERPLPGF